VRHRLDGEAPEADDAVAVVRVYARRVDEEVAHMFERYAGSRRKCCALDGLTVGQQVVEGKRRRHTTGGSIPGSPTR
jgi:hypothetical protein